LTLPAAVEENLRQTLSFELDRYTPFKSDQAYFDMRITGRDSGLKRLSVLLVVAPQTVVSQGLSQAASIGLAIDGATLADDVLRNGRDCLNLLPASAKGNGRPTTLSWWRMASLTAALALLAAVVAIPIWQKRDSAISLLEPLAQAKLAAQETDARRDHLKELVEEYTLLPSKKWEATSTLRLLDELSRRLPDDTFVVQLDFDGKTVQLQGESGSSPGLIEALEASPILKDVGFKSQLTKIQGTGNDRYHIAGTLETAPREAPAIPAPPDSSPAKEPLAPSASPSTTPTPQVRSSTPTVGGISAASKS
jgi:general secretion pathway protein L